MAQINKIKARLKKTRVGIVAMKIKQRGVKIKRAAIRWTKFKCLYPFWYWLHSHKPCEVNKVIFIEHRYNKLSNSYHLLFDKLLADYQFSVHTHFLKEGFVGGFESIGRCLNMIRDLATASYVFVSDGSHTIGCLPIREQTRVLNTWHGCGAFKRFGYSTADLLFGDNRKGMERYPSHKNYSYVTVSSPEVVWAYEEAMNLSETNVVRPVGISRTDIFFDEDFIQNAKNTLDHIISGSAGKKVILYAPTFRGRVATAKAPNLLNIGMFHQALGDEYILLIKHHPLVKKLPEISSQYADFAFDVTNKLSIEELICVADICISDYSSLIYEYSLFEKPMLFFAFDLDEYFDWRGFYYDYDELTPGPVFTTNREMIEYIQHIEERFDPTVVQRFRQKFMSSCDGHATERILQLMFGDALEKYRRINTKPAQYHLIPNAVRNFTAARDEKKILAQKKRVSSVYEHACKHAVDEGKVVFLQVRDEMSEQFSRLEQWVSDQPQMHGITMQITKQNAAACMKELATAGTIFLEDDNIWIDMIAVRKETQIIYLPRVPVLVKRRYYDSVEAMGNLREERMQYAPFFANGGTVLVPIDADIHPWKRCVGGQNTFNFLKSGNYNALCLWDLQYQQTVKQKIVNLVPEAEGKQIVLYAPTKRINTVGTKMRYLEYSLLYEYLPENYIVLCYYGDGKMPTVSKYYHKKIVNCTKLLAFEELLAVSDVIVADYQPILFECAKAGRTLFRHTPDEEGYLENEQINVSAFRQLPGEKVEDTMDFLQKLQESIRAESKVLHDLANKKSEKEACELVLKQLLLKKE